MRLVDGYILWADVRRWSFNMMYLMDLDWNAFHPSLDKVFKIKIVITGGFTRTSQFDVVGTEKKTLLEVLEISF